MFRAGISYVVNYCEYHFVKKIPMFIVTLSVVCMNAVVNRRPIVAAHKVLVCLRNFFFFLHNWHNSELF